MLSPVLQQFCDSLDIILFNVRRFLSFSFGFRPLFLSAAFLWFVYGIRTLEITALDTRNKMAVAVTEAPAKRAPTMRPLSKSDKSPIL